MEANYVVRFYPPNSSIEDSVQLMLEDGFEELPEYIINREWGLIVSTFLLGMVAMNLTGKGFIVWYVKYWAQTWPLNTLILVEQVHNSLKFTQNRKKFHFS